MDSTTKSLETSYTRSVKAQFGTNSREYHNALEASRKDLEDDIASQLESLRCRECGNTPETGACFYCKAD